ncbi:hypothetical protein [Mesorhizobium sp. INR15]|uniref:hypothetical protein n=1 Tax=Mesorhizobium sp. INR15 TaxID=2654248 RepID=UPI001896695E|nr:hypothetical protein [Mesorhizobium sp. INR15]
MEAAAIALILKIVFARAILPTLWIAPTPWVTKRNRRCRLAQGKPNQKADQEKRRRDCPAAFDFTGECRNRYL